MYFDIEEGGSPLGRVVFGLYGDVSVFYKRAAQLEVLLSSPSSK